MRQPTTLLCVALSFCTLLNPARAQERRAGPPMTTAEIVLQQWSRGQAQGENPVRLSTFPLRFDEIDHIRPLGMMTGGHVTPSDHLYIVPVQDRPKEAAFDVVAVADGRVVMVQWRPKGNPDPAAFDREVDYKVFIEHSKTVWSYVDHLAEVAPDILKQAAQEVRPGRPVNLRVAVKAGQAIGKVYRAFDFALVDTTFNRKGFIDPDQFLQRDPWKPHTVDPFDYVEEALRARLVAKNARKAAPPGGRIDYDIDGRIAGNWYKKDSGGYAGLHRRLDYWVGHLTLAYHYIDPKQIIVSIGEFEGRARQFQVANNAPDPASIGKAQGLVKYELLRPHISDRDGTALADHDARVHGVLLVQLLEDRQLRVEAFPGKRAEQVAGFTAAAATYER